MAKGYKDKNNVVVIKYEPKRNTERVVKRDIHKGFFKTTDISIDENNNKVSTTTRTFSSASAGNFILKIIGFIIILLLSVYVINVARGGATPKTFTSFLEMITNSPTVEVPFLNLPSTALGDWGAFNFLRSFIMLMIQSVNIFIFLLNGIINFVQYVVYFAQWIFTV